MTSLQDCKKRVNEDLLLVNPNGEKYLGHINLEGEEITGSCFLKNFVNSSVNMNRVRLEGDRINFTNELIEGDLLAQRMKAGHATFSFGMGDLEGNFLAKGITVNNLMIGHGFEASDSTQKIDLAYSRLFYLYLFPTFQGTINLRDAIIDKFTFMGFNSFEMKLNNTYIGAYDGPENRNFGEGAEIITNKRTKIPSNLRKLLQRSERSEN